MRGRPRTPPVVFPGRLCRLSGLPGRCRPLVLGPRCVLAVGGTYAAIFPEIGEPVGPTSPLALYQRATMVAVLPASSGR